jgi:hypothetical protein
MGYYTTFTGNVTGPSELLNEFMIDADNGHKFGAYDFDLNDWFDDIIGGDAMKWYDWNDDLASISKDYPNLLFSLEGEGEESGDIWKAWARNGKVVVVKAEIKFREPDFDKELPAPDVDKAVQETKNKKRAEIEAQIAKLQAEKEALD